VRELLSEQVIQVVLHPVLRPSFEKWLDENGWLLLPIPVGDDDLPTYSISPKDEA
jgi:hypothetical protein